jgi:hypothetical protein
VKAIATVTLVAESTTAQESLLRMPIKLFRKLADY